MVNCYPFTATTVAQNILTANPGRRRLYLQSYGPPDVNDNVSIWLQWNGGVAVAQQCWQVIAGATWEWGGGDDYIAYLQMRFASCPTGAISVVVGSGTHAGVFYEFT